MRRAFLDSQVAIWAATGDARLTTPVRRAINGHSVTVISAITIAELEMKAAIGKFSLPRNLVGLYEAEGIVVEAFDALASERLSRFPQLNRHDPFDRMILAHAASRLGTTFFTADEALIDLGLDWVAAV